MWDVDPDTQAGAGRAPERVLSVPCSLRSAYLYRPRAVWHVLTRVRLMSGTRQAYFEITRLHTQGSTPPISDRIQQRLLNLLVIWNAQKE